jgi:hypothetical protein
MPGMALRKTRGQIEREQRRLDAWMTSHQDDS